MSLQQQRIGRATRKTGETEIELTINLDGTAKTRIATGIGFLDHMLTLFAVHGLFDLSITATGDLHIDEHHIAEDTCICLGRAIAQALDQRTGIVRTAHSYVPMDEALSRVVIDLGGRPYSVFEANFKASHIGDLSTDLLYHLFESIAFHAGMNVHATVIYGRNDHHKAESLFKALGKALDRATQIDPRRPGVPSSKGTLIA